MTPPSRSQSQPLQMGFGSLSVLTSFLGWYCNFVNVKAADIPNFGLTEMWVVWIPVLAISFLLAAFNFSNVHFFGAFSFNFFRSLLFVWFELRTMRKTSSHFQFSMKTNFNCNAFYMLRKEIQWDEKWNKSWKDREKRQTKVQPFFCTQLNDSK